MWEINYDDPWKLSMSIGIGLVLAGFLLLLTHAIAFSDKVTNINEDYYKMMPLFENCRDSNITKDLLVTYQEMLKIKTKVMIDTNKNIFIMSIILIVPGMILFLIGLIPFLKRHKVMK